VTGRTDRIIKLQDGRTLGYTEYGDPEGTPVFYFHGWPSSRLEAQLTRAAAAWYRVRVIAPDRPGFGLSDFKPGRRIGDWPDDVAELADHLRLDRFAVVGISGGGPYAAACALKIPDRLTAAGIISGMGPIDAPGATDTTGMSWQKRLAFFLACRVPWLMRVPLALMVRRYRRDPDRVISGMTSLPQADEIVLARPEVRQVMIDTTLEAFRSGTRGPAWEAGLYTCPWDFQLQDISMEVHLWHGEADVNIPVSIGRYQADLIPDCRARFYSDEGHFSLAIKHADEILEALITS